MLSLHYMIQLHQTFDFKSNSSLNYEQTYAHILIKIMVRRRSLQINTEYTRQKPI